MSPQPRRTRLAVLALGAALILPWSATAQPARKAPSPQTERTPASWDLLPRAWSLLISLWAEEGCIIDPNGCARSQTAAPVPADGGCIIDPSGLYAAASQNAEQLDAGCIIDPNGHQ